MQVGLAKLTEEIAADAPRGLLDDLWRLAYTRNRTDIDRARPYADRHHSGILVYARRLDAERSVVVIDTGERLVGAVDRFQPVRVGSAVRLGPAGYTEPLTWKISVDEAFPLDVTVAFDRPAPTRAEPRWVGIFRAALVEIRAAEARRLERIGAERRAIPPFEKAPPVDARVSDWIAGLRREVERETDYTQAERRELRQARSVRREALHGERRARFEALLRARMESLRETLPALRAARAGVLARNEATHAALRRLEDAETQSRSRSAAAAAALRVLERLADAPFTVEIEDVPGGLEDPARARDVLRALALLERAVPRVVNVRVAV